MICYKDMTFCANRNCEKDCKRKITEKVIQESNLYNLNLSVAGFVCNEENNFEYFWKE